MNLPIITNVTGYAKDSQLTTILFECNLFDGRGILSRSFQVNNYELHWFYKSLGWDLTYSPFVDFWTDANEEDRKTFLFLLITKEDSIVSQSAKAKVRAELVPAKSISIVKHPFKWAS